MKYLRQMHKHYKVNENQRYNRTHNHYGFLIHLKFSANSSKTIKCINPLKREVCLSNIKELSS